MASAPNALDKQVVLDLSSTFGAMLIGGFLAWMIYGISCLQLFIYFQHCERDSISLRTYVGLVWAFDTANQILMFKGLWPVLIKHWGNVGLVEQLVPEIIHHIWVSGVVAMAVQCFFLYRMYIFGRRRWLLPTLIAIVASYQIFQSIPLQIILHEDFVLPNLFSRRVMALNISVRGVSAIVDVAIATTMFVHLRQQDIEFRKTKRVVDRLLLLTVNSGAWTALFATLVAVTISAVQDGLYFMIFEIPLSSLYLSSLLANLNAREYVRRKLDLHEISGSVHRADLEAGIGSKGSTYPVQLRTDNMMMINIETTAMTKIDDPY